MFPIALVLPWKPDISLGDLPLSVCPPHGCPVVSCDSEHFPALHEVLYKHHTSHPALIFIPKIILRLPLLSPLSFWVFLPLCGWKFSYKEGHKAKLWSYQYLGLPRVVPSGTPQTHPDAHLLHNCPARGVCSLRSSSHLLIQKNIQEKTVFTTSCAWDQLQKEFYLLSFSLDCQPARITNNVSHC